MTIESSKISIHALLAESDRAWRKSDASMTISIHALLAESDIRLSPCPAAYGHFYPRSPCGERPPTRQKKRPRANFYPRSPCGERPGGQSILVQVVEFLSTLSLRRATAWRSLLRRGRMISIHALLAESDNVKAYNLDSVLISIHALLAESDAAPGAVRVALKEFLSTLSLRRATGCLPGAVYNAIISIHALLAESDPEIDDGTAWAMTFLSTLSLRRATAKVARNPRRPGDFYPRSPCGERRSVFELPPAPLPISIHALLAESDRNIPKLPRAAIISIHALLAESDSISARCVFSFMKFLSTLSLRRAT